MLSLGVGLTSVPVLARRGAPIVYDPDALAFFARLTNQPTDVRKKLYSDLIASLKTAGVWAKLDALYILAAADAQAARQNLVANAYNLTAIGSPTFTADRGYSGDGVGAYLETGAPNSGFAKFSQNDASFGFWSRSDVSGTGRDIGLSAGASIFLNGRNVSNIQARVNTTATPSSAVANSTGFYGGRRTGTTHSIFKSGSILSTITDTSAATTTTTFNILQGAGLYSARQGALAFIGGYIDDTQVAALNTAAATYMTAVGA